MISNIVIVTLLCLILGTYALTQSPGSLQGIASGSIQISNGVSGPPALYKNYSVTFDSELGSSPASYAFGKYATTQV